MAISPGRHRVLDMDILEYVAAHSSKADRVQADLQRATQRLTGGASIMQIGHDQAVMMETLVRATGVRNAIEVGTFQVAGQIQRVQPKRPSDKSVARIVKRRAADHAPDRAPIDRHGQALDKGRESVARERGQSGRTVDRHD
jgi:hypothetical protein